MYHAIGDHLGARILPSSHERDFEFGFRASVPHGRSCNAPNLGRVPDNILSLDCFFSTAALRHAYEPSALEGIPLKDESISALATCRLTLSDTGCRLLGRLRFGIMTLAKRQREATGFL